jgi:plastocyanin
VYRNRVARLLILAGLLLGGCDRVPGVDGPAEEGDDLLDRISRPAGGQVHLVRLVDGRGDHRFDPAEIVIGPGHVVRFVMAGSVPESVAFEATGASPEAANYIHEHGFHRGVLLTEPGQAVDVSFADAPPGRYPFVSVPRGVRGVVVVRE